VRETIGAKFSRYSTMPLETIARVDPKNRLWRLTISMSCWRPKRWQDMFEWSEVPPVSTSDINTNISDIQIIDLMTICVYGAEYSGNPEFANWWHVHRFVSGLKSPSRIESIFKYSQHSTQTRNMLKSYTNSLRRRRILKTSPELFRIIS
jgi:hypothetical protein